MNNREYLPYILRLEEKWLRSQSDDLMGIIAS